jgi:hypothetical protein
LVRPASHQRGARFCPELGGDGHPLETFEEFAK